MLSWYHILRNAVDYPIRQLIRWRRGAPRPISADKSQAYAHLKPTEAQKAEERAHELIEEYKLHEFASTSSVDDYTINLFYLEMLVTTFAQSGVQLPDIPRLRVADVGPGAWTYAPAFHSFLKYGDIRTPREVEVAGFEIDAYRVFSDFRSRFDHAHENLSKLPGMSFHSEPFHAQPNAFNLITLFYPFIFLTDHLKWGLPKKLFLPEKLLQNAWESLEAGGILFIANQGPEEFEQQQELFKQVGIPDGLSFHFKSDLHAYEIPRYAHIRIRA